MKSARGDGITRIADLVFLTRPPLLCASATFFFVGAISALRYRTGCYLISPMVEALPNLGLFLLLTASAFVVNQIFDVSSDALNRKNFLLPSGVVTRTEAAAVLGALVAVLIVVAILRGGALGLLALAGLVVGLAYSVPPLRLKARPVADLLANVTGFGLIGFLLGWLVFADLSLEALARSTPYAISMGGVFLNTCVADEAGDRAVGDRTSCVALGAAPASIAALALVTLAVPVAVAVDEPLCAVAAGAAVPGLVRVAFRRTARTSVLASQIAAIALLVLVSVCAPILAGMSVVTYAASRLYYRRRFGVSYPRFGGADLGAEGGSPRPGAGASP